MRRTFTDGSPDRSPLDLTLVAPERRDPPRARRVLQWDFGSARELIAAGEEAASRAVAVISSDLGLAATTAAGSHANG